MLEPKIIVVIIFVLITLYGVITKKRVFFNLGYFLYGLSVFVAELNEYFDVQSFSHLLFAILFLPFYVITGIWQLVTEILNQIPL